MREIESILTSILHCQRADLYLSDNALKSKQIDRLSSALIRRIKGEPLEYILKFSEFMGLTFKINKEVFIPRPETEVLVETALDILKYKSIHKYKILDVGTGCGNIAISLAALLPESQITAVDISSEALKVARENARLNQVQERVKFLKSDLFGVFDKIKSTRSSQVLKFDMIISNPPYIVSSEIRQLAIEVRSEPRTALDGGFDGLNFYRRIIKESPAYLKNQGILIMEMGYNQAEPMVDIFKELGKFKVLRVIKDYNKIDRIIVAKHIK